MFERFSRGAREVVIRAQEEAGALGHEWIGTEHLLLAALHLPEQPGASTLRRNGVTAASCREAVAGVVTGTQDDLGPKDAEALRALGIDLEEIRRHAESAFGEGALDGPPDARGSRRGRAREQRAFSRHIPFTARAKGVLKDALREALARKDRRIGVEHIVLGALGSGDALSRTLFTRLGIDPDDVRAQVLRDLRADAA